MAWFTNKNIFDELLKKRNEGVDVKIIIDNNRVNRMCSMILSALGRIQLR